MPRFGFAAIFPLILVIYPGYQLVAASNSDSDVETALSICKLSNVKSSTAKWIDDWRGKYVPEFSQRIKDARGTPSLVNVRLGTNPQNVATAWTEDDQWQTVFCEADYTTQFYVDAFPPLLAPFLIKDVQYAVTMRKVDGEQMSLHINLPEGQLFSKEQTDSSMWDRMSIRGVSLRNLNETKPTEQRSVQVGDYVASQVQAELDQFMDENGLDKSTNGQPVDTEFAALQTEKHRVWRLFASARYRYHTRYKSEGVKVANELESKARLTCGQNDLTVDRKLYMRCMIENYVRITNYLNSQ